MPSFPGGPGGPGSPGEPRGPGLCYNTNNPKKM